jgi:hypothetical protein
MDNIVNLSLKIIVLTIARMEGTASPHQAFHAHTYGRFLVIEAYHL